MQLFSKINQLSFTLTQVNTGNVSQYLLITSLLPVCEVLHILIMKYGIKNKYYAKKLGPCHKHLRIFTHTNTGIVHGSAEKKHTIT